MRNSLIEPQDRSSYPFPLQAIHSVLNVPLENSTGEVIYVGLGCFWGAERIFWQHPGVLATSVGYAGGRFGYPFYEEVCTGKTGHTEVVKVNYDPAVLSDAEIIRFFFENHDPTQGNRQGNDIGTQYRSALYYTTESQHQQALLMKSAYEAELRSKGYGEITTEIAPAPKYYFAEEYHQQYLHKVPNGYCGIGGTGVSCPLPIS